MKNTGAEPGEKCALCRNDMNPGATVCGHCRARREIVREIGFFRKLFGGILIVMMIPATILFLLSGVGAFTGNLFTFTAVGFVIFITPLALIWVIWRSGKEVVMYYPPRNLQQENAAIREEERRRRLL